MGGRGRGGRVRAGGQLGILPGGMIVLDCTQSAPHGAVALEAGPESDLPHAVAASHVAHALNGAQHIPVDNSHG